MHAALQSVDFADSTGATIDGLVSVHDPPHDLTPDEATVIRDAASFEHVTYVFFRRFADSRSSQPAAFVVDNEKEHLDNAMLAKLHNELWLHGVTPLVYVSWQTRIDILSCARGPDFWHAEQQEPQYNPAMQLDLANRVESELQRKRRQRFSAYRLADGTFWDDPQNRPLAKHEKTAHELLIQAIIETDQALEGETNPTMRRLLILMVLIKYLEDRQVFPSPAWFGNFHKGARSFFDVLYSGEPDKVLRLLRNLEERFNGDVFALPTGTRLTKTALRNFARLVEAKTIKQQRYLWHQFSFAHLPVEIISHLYQRFVKGSTAVYTPPFLASLLLDYAMPFEKLSGKERVLDPACGSGVFLVGAYRRLVAAYRAKHKSPPNVTTLKSILKNQIFGVETDANAIDLTAFSLALAVCDALKPKVIWNQLRFDPLRDHNLIEADFFATKYTKQEKGTSDKFDVVIGNPPFESEFSPAAKQFDKDRPSERGRIPDNQIAYLFLDVGMQVITPNGVMCLIQPHGFLYNLKSHSFRAAIAKSGRLSAILDFVSIRGLYDRADPKTVALLIKKQSELPISHLTFRRTYEVTQKIGFELNHYESNELVVSEILENPRAARPNLLGGGRLKSVAQRIGSMRTTKEYVANRGWIIGEGFIVGNRKNRAKFLTGKPLLRTQDLNDIGFDRGCLSKVEETHFEAPRKPELYESPLIVIKESDSLPIAFWDQGPLAYKHKIIGIHAPKSEESQLLQLYRTFLKHRSTLRFIVALNGSQALVGKATALLKSDVEEIPIPENESDLELTYWEAALAEDTLSHFVEFIRLGQDSELMKNGADTESIKRLTKNLVVGDLVT